jgi:hypothetical protein
MSELAAHEGSGIRYRMHLSAPNGGVAQMVRSPDGDWVEHAEYERKCVQLRHVMDLVGALMVELDDTKAKLKEIERK